ncbi:TIGR03085 family protein [Actinoplanes sp. TBRC 11911]|uniref:TIGR03085 family metal-binding protein n=1 Tax=Actinoplanes sp. TBRC 11911 TaxID=2729386 RepID=UPI00145CDBBF|nr:TIGR03085 family metal-binding protein [Actinoplanes sp. TBRC 11911]NMO55846.1 TIGR03085 family protein [Actinoplanes sp. TBRC 11911]
MNSYAKLERRQLADLLEKLGPDVPTLCEGWTTRDLAAHLVVRERRPDAVVGNYVRPLREHGENVRLAKAAQAYAAVLQEFRRPPRWSPVSNPLVDELTNSGEFFIHHEDARRGQPGWEPRTLDPGQEQALWRTLKITGKIALRRLGVPAAIKADGFGEFVVGGEPQVTISGPPGELTLFLSGRQRAARVSVSGEDGPSQRVQKARLGF